MSPNKELSMSSAKKKRLEVLTRWRKVFDDSLKGFYIPLKPQWEKEFAKLEHQSHLSPRRRERKS